ncbi:MAG: DNA-binding MarR family transcriptional regulator [Celeribacter sp.]|jgi:DNA-binding MarR family transcriptional regulator
MTVQGMAGHVIRRLNQLSTQVFTKNIQRAGFDLTSVQFAAMDSIAHFPGIDQAGLAAKIAYDRATIGGVVDRLEQKGYVIRNVCKRDRRAREVRLTDEGQKALDEIFPVVDALQGEILSGLDPLEQRRFLELANKAMSTTPELDPNKIDVTLR